ncbi:MAG TPA: glutamate--tRNA ligase [Hyphomicrobiaceae bacterium]|nr:glutamate--tRNA ligase [Hyphomicrobiaceae bacterium]
MANTAAANVITRFAPSPTGLLHIGGARTALFNWLYSKHTGGKFLLRIEDTDRERSKPEHVAAILDGLRWLGLDWDGEPISQFSRVARHQEVARDLLARGRAYHCYLTAEELAAMRAKAEAEKRPFTVVSPWRDRDPSEAPPGVKPALRIRTEREGETVVEDQVQGRVVFPNKDLDDMIILRSDGAPTYNFAVVVDDHDMGITHVIRGVDHLTNTARQLQVYKACGWATPRFAHIPLVHGPDGAKLSKRHGAQGVEEYRAMGYLPAALRNYLARLGWSHGDDEIFSTEQAVQWFDITDVGKSPGRFDFVKLADLNGHYIRHTPDGELVRHIAALLPVIEGGPALAAKLDANDGWKRLSALLPSLKERAKTLVELLDQASFLFIERPIALDDKAAKVLDADARRQIGLLLPRLMRVTPFEAGPLEVEVRRFAEETGAKLGKVAQPLRAALTGRTVSPPVFDVLQALGAQEASARLKDHAI